MKILSTSQIRDLDQYTIQNEPIASIDLMERASLACTNWITSKFNTDFTFKIFCGLGNNGGDGLAIARQLSDRGYKILVYIIRYSDKSSDDFNANYEKLKQLKVEIIEVENDKSLPQFNNQDVIIDALFGTGLSRPIDGIVSSVIEHINRSQKLVVSIDLPSGLFADSKSENKSIIRADYTLSFEFPKLAFMFPENDIFVGQWEVLLIGLSKERIAGTKSGKYYLTSDIIKQIIKPRNRFSHKGTFGHALIIGGSYGKMGAAVLASRACLRIGAGLVTVHVPQCGYDIIQTSVPEAMASVDKAETHFTEHIKTFPYSAIGIGPGLSTHPETVEALKFLIQSIAVPLVIDADALNILSENKTWLSFIPENSILTPHPKEFERLAGKSSDGFDRHQMLINFAIKYKVYVILKGAHSCIACPDGTTYFNSTGNAGMATGGSGDVLTGILTGLLAQGYKPIDASLAGVFLHGLSGDISIEKQSEESLIASDIIENIGKAYKSVI